VGQIGDVRLLLMAALIVGDELREAQGRVEALEETLTDTRGRLSQAEARRRADRARAAEAINAAAARLEALAADSAGDEQDA
jgi:cell division protein ZapA